MPIVRVDMTEAAEGGAFNSVNVDEDDYLGTIKKVEVAEIKSGDNAGDDQLVLTVVLDKVPRGSYPYYLPLSGPGTWKLRNVLTACGMAAPKKAANLNTDKLLNKKVGCSMEDDEYKGKLRSRIANIIGTDELSAAAKNGKPATKKTEVEATEEDELPTAETEEVDLDEL